MRIALIGFGKMGHILRDVALQRGHTIACAIDVQASSLLDEANPFPIFTPQEGFQSDALRSADVAIEFSTPATAKQNILQAWEAGLPVICGTTGWEVEELRRKNEELRKTTGRNMFVWKSNFSIGVNLFFDMNRSLAATMNEQTQYTPSVTETHHIHKLDKPSGTAKTIAEDIAKQRQCDWTEIPVESIREGEVAGIHTVTWDSPEDTIVITHIAKGRTGFALGAVIEAEKIVRNK